MTPSKIKRNKMIFALAMLVIATLGCAYISIDYKMYAIVGYPISLLLIAYYIFDHAIIYKEDEEEELEE